jgi:hypothetical protein
MRAKLKAIKVKLRKRIHDPIATTGSWVKQALQGHLNYYAVSEGGRSVSWKRCDQVIDKGSRRWLGGSAACIDGVELDRSCIPFR